MISHVHPFLLSIKALKERVKVLEKLNDDHRAEIHVLQKRVDAVDALERAHQAEKALLAEREDAWRAILESVVGSHAWRDTFKSYEERLDRLTKQVDRMDEELEVVRCGEETQRELYNLVQ